MPSLCNYLMCNYCGEGYAEEDGHDYDECVKKCKAHRLWAKKQLFQAERSLAGAKEVQAQDWWKVELVKGRLRKHA
jgi:hypothetical protein